MRPDHSPSAASRRLARAAAGLAFLSAAGSLYWTLGGTALLDTIGGKVEDLARERSAAAGAAGAATALLKTFAGVLALALARARYGRLGRRWVLRLNGAASAALILWGGANVLIGGLVLADVIRPGSSVDERSLRWHVFLWDLWFLVWGAVTALALASSRSVTASGRGHQATI